MWEGGEGLCFVLFFSRGGRSLSSTCCYGFVFLFLYVREKKLTCWRTGQASLDYDTDVIRFGSSAQLLGVVTPVGTEGGTPGGLQYPWFSWYNGTWTFSLYCSLLLTSLVHTAAVFMVIDTFAAAATPRPPPPHAANHDTHRIDFTDWITLPVLFVCVCVFVCGQCVLKDIYTVYMSRVNIYHCFFLKGPY